MPRVRGQFGPYRLFFTSFDCIEPAHVHVERDGMRCKFWLDPVRLANHGGFDMRELNRIETLIRSHLAVILELWNAHCHPR